MDSTLVSSLRVVSSRRSRPTEARSGEEMHRRDKDQHNYSKSAATHRSDVIHGLTRSLGVDEVHQYLLQSPDSESSKPVSRSATFISAAEVLPVA